MAPRRLPPAAPRGTASIYVRLSREAAEENLSKEGMVEDCQALAEREGLRVVSVHVDDGISGAVRNRPEFVGWLNDARELRADVLIAWHVDRMTREGVNVAALILDAVEGKDPETGKFIRQPVRLMDTKGLDSVGDETTFRFRFVIAAEVARAERERMRDRAKAARTRALSSGRWSGGPAPFGFRIVENPDGAGRVLEVEPSEADAIREATARVLAGTNLSSVVRWMNGPEGIAPRRAKAWSRRTLTQILTGGPAAGKVTRIVTDQDGHSKAVPVLGHDGRPVTLPAVLTADESAALRAALAVVPDDRKAGGRKTARLLSGLLTCHGCQTRMQVARRTDGSVTYRCQTSREAGICPAPVSVSAPALEGYLTEEFLRVSGDQPAYVRRAEVSGAAAIEAAEEAVSAALAALAAAPTPENLAAYQDAQRVRDEAVEAPSETVTRLVPTGLTIAETWEAADVADRREMLAANLAAIVVKPGRRGPRGISPDRLDVVWTAPHPVEHVDAETYVPGVATV